MGTENPSNANAELCFECAKEVPLFSRAVSFGAYEGTLRELIHLLKYQHVRPAARLLGQWVAQAASTLTQEFGDDVLVMPVPLHKSKFSDRGFNQSELMAHYAVRELQKIDDRKFQLETRVLLRRRRTESQVGMSREQRKTNLRGAFEVLAKERVRGREVLLIDDVLTTGATVGECARVLLKAGAARVWVATVARAVKLQVVSASYLHGEDESFAVGGLYATASAHTHSNQGL